MRPDDEEAVELSLGFFNDVKPILSKHMERAGNVREAALVIATLGFILREALAAAPSEKVADAVMAIIDVGFSKPSEKRKIPTLEHWVDRAKEMRDFFNGIKTTQTQKSGEA